MKKKLLVIMAIVLITVALSGCCSHEWQEATCTEPETCALCGQTNGEALDHKKGEWSEWMIDYNNLIMTKELYCTRCEEIMETEEGEEVASFIQNGVMMISPNGFSKRFDSSVINDYEFDSELDYDDDKEFYDEDNLLFYEIENNDYRIGMYSFVGEGGKTLPYQNEFTAGVATGINLLIEDASDVSAVVFATVQAIDPAIDYNESADLSQRIVDNVGNMEGVSNNSIKYILYKDNKYHYLVVAFLSESGAEIEEAGNALSPLNKDDIEDDVDKIKEMISYDGQKKDKAINKYSKLKDDDWNTLLMSGKLFGINGKVGFLYDRDTNKIDSVIFEWIPDNMETHEDHMVDCLSSYFGECKDIDEFYSGDTTYYYHDWDGTTEENWSVHLSMTEDSGYLQISQIVN